MRITEATPEQLRDWDAHTVDVPGGNVYQSRTWAEQRSKVGWTPRFLVFEDGFRLLSLERPWKQIGGAGAYLSKGPVSNGEPASTTAERLVAAAEYLASVGVDVVSSDAEIEASTGYPALIEAAGFKPIEEVQPSRHRVALALEPHGDENAVFMGCQAAVRQRVRGAEKKGCRVVRWDVRHLTDPTPGFELPKGLVEAGSTPEALVELARPELLRFHELLVTTAERRHFGLGAREPFIDWSLAGLAAGLVVFLQVLGPNDELLSSATFYRHGGRLTYSHSGDRADLRREYPGVIHLMLWRAIQLCLRDGMIEMDFAGVDVPGKRAEPVEGEEMYGLYAFKRSFGAEWVELTGNHERVMNAGRYALGRLMGKLRR